MTLSEKLIKAPLFSFPLNLFFNVSLYTQFFACAEYVFGTFFLVYPGSVFEMLFLPECPKELMILIVVKKEQEYKIQAVL